MQAVTTASAAQGGPRRPRPLLTRWARAAAVLTLLAWLVLVTLGMLVDSKPYRDSVALASQHSLGRVAADCAVVLLTYTLPNTLVLSCLAGLLGAYGQRARLGDGEDRLIPLDLSYPYMSGLLRGFFVYLVVLSGAMVLTEAPMTPDSADAYLRIAGFLSLSSFLVSYNPQLFGAFMVRAAGFVQGRAGSEPPHPELVDDGMEAPSPPAAEPTPDSMRVAPG
jgi:hypothetical protein